MRGGGLIMQGAVLALFGAALAAGLAELLLPDRENGTAKLFRFLVSLVVLLVILIPFGGFLQNSGEILSGEIPFEEQEMTELEQTFSEAVNAQGKKEFEKGLYALLAREYGIPQKNVTPLVRFDPQGELACVTLFLSGEALLQNPDTLETALSKKLGCTVEVR